jgi:hypothetical protein
MGCTFESCLEQYAKALCAVQAEGFYNRYAPMRLVSQSQDKKLPIILFIWYNKP